MPTNTGIVPGLGGTPDVVSTMFVSDGNGTTLYQTTYSDGSIVYTSSPGGATVTPVGGVVPFEGTPIQFTEEIFFVRNNSGTIETSDDNATWTANPGPHIPAGVSSFYVMNLGLNGDGDPYSDIQLDMDGITRVMDGLEESYEETVQTDGNTLTGNITVEPDDDHIVKVAYKTIL